MLCRPRRRKHVAAPVLPQKPPSTSIEALESMETKLVIPRWHVVARQDDSRLLTQRCVRLKRALESEKLALKFEAYAFDEATLKRFLTAKDNDVQKAKRLLLASLEWRETRHPYVHDYRELEVKGRTGKVRVCPSLDRWGRPVIVFDNSVQNTQEANVRFLAFNLEHAVRRCVAPVEK